jgi:hypothetical protein
MLNALSSLPLSALSHLTVIMAPKIDINSAPARELTQLPGVAKNVAYRIVNHRKRHGLFTHWAELAEVKDFSLDALDRIKERATLGREAGLGPRRMKPEHTEAVAKKPRGYTKAIRATRRQERLKPSA